MRRRAFLAAVLCAWVVAAPGGGVAAPGAATLQAASQLVGGLPGGIAVVIGPGGAEMAVAISKQGNFAVQCLAPDRASCDALRARIRAAGVYGDVSADVLPGGRLPYVENLVNLVVVEPGMDVAPAEVLRVLAPLGTACFVAGSAAQVDALKAKLSDAPWGHLGVMQVGATWVFRGTKPWPADIDEWGHFLHGADGNPVAQDRVVGPPRHYQWVADPRNMISHETDSSLSTLVTARGRLFSIINEAPNSLEGFTLPDKWSLVAQDAFNGTFLWKVPIRRWGWREWKNHWFSSRPSDIPLNIQKRLVAAGDRVYVTLGYRAPVSQLDAATGRLLRSYAGTEGASEILYLDGTLVLAVQDNYKAKVMAVDAGTGKVLWTSAKAYRGSVTDYIRWAESGGGIQASKLDPALNLATDGSVVALLDGPDVAGLDLTTGAERWHVKFPIAPADANAGGMRSGDNTWVGAMIATDGVVLCASPSVLAAFSGATGKLLWTRPKQFIGHLWYEWKDVFVIDGLVWTWSAELERSSARIGGSRWPLFANGYDLKTGALVKKVSTGHILDANHHHRCYRDKATVRYLLASVRGSEYISLEGGKHTADNWVRGTCHVGMMPANGLEYAPPHPCECYIEEKLVGYNALAPELPAQERVPEPGPKLEKGPAYAAALPVAKAGAQDWPVYRHDGARSGAVSTKVPDALTTLWRVRPGGKATPPVIAAGKVYAALVDEHTVLCLDAKDGRKVWQFTAGARVDSPPAWYEGRILFGAADGWVYCLRAGDGQLVWRFRAAPDDRQMACRGQLESVWPVRGSVLVQNGVLYCAAGRSSHLDGGIRLYGLEPATGAIVCRRTLAGPVLDVDNVKVNFGQPLGWLNDILAGDGTNVFLRASAFDGKLEDGQARPALLPRGGYLDGTFFKRAPWILPGMVDGWANVIVADKQDAYFLRMFDSLQALSPNVFFTPGKQGYQLFSRSLSGARRWAERIPIRGKTLALTTGRLFVAGPPDVVDPKDPLGAFEGRKGGVLLAVDAATGKKVAQYKLPAPPVFNGAAAAAGRLYLSGEDGSITCFGGK